MKTEDLLMKSMENPETGKKLKEARQPTAQNVQAGVADQVSHEEAKAFIKTLEAAYKMEQDGGDPRKFMNEDLKMAYHAYKQDRDEDKKGQLEQLVCALRGDYGWAGVAQSGGSMAADAVASSIGGWGGFLLKFANRTGLLGSFVDKCNGYAEAEKTVQAAQNMIRQGNNAARATATAQTPNTATIAAPDVSSTLQQAQQADNQAPSMDLMAAANTVRGGNNSR